MCEKLISFFQQINYLQATFVSVVAVMALLMVDSVCATHRKLERKDYSSASQIFNVVDYGALAGGLADDSLVNTF